MATLTRIKYETDDWQIHAGEAYLSFNRRLKELWLFGKIRDIGEGEEEDAGHMSPNSSKVAEMVEKLIQAQRSGKADASALRSLEIGKAAVEDAERQSESVSQGANADYNGDVEMS